MRIIFCVSVLTSMVFSCNTNTNKNEVEASEATVIEEKGSAVSWNIDQDNSGIEWWGSKPTGIHNGTIDLSSAYFEVENGSISSGKVIVDMSSIKVLDMDDDGNSKLGSHLRDGDFFETNTHPTASFEFIELTQKEFWTVEGSDTLIHGYWGLEGNLSIKDSVKKVFLRLPQAEAATSQGVKHVKENSINMTVNDSVIILETDSFSIDRTQWGITYKSNSVFSDLGEKFIHDNIGLKIKIKATR